jgi:hypothetical protein
MTGMACRAVAVDMADHWPCTAPPQFPSTLTYTAESVGIEASAVDLDEAGDILLSRLKQVSGGRPVTATRSAVQGHRA